MKVIIDPEMPFSIFRVDRENKKPLPAPGLPPVFSPFDENGLEAALKIKDQQECHITIISLGKSIAKSLIQKALAAGADEAIIIEGPEFENIDPFSTAQTLAAAIRKIGEFDLIFMGRQGADWDAGIVWAGVAEMLDIPSIPLARNAQVQDQKVIVERCLQDGIETIEAHMPALVTFSNEGGVLRSISLASLMKVKNKKISKLDPTEFAINKNSFIHLKDLYPPDIGGTNCEIIGGVDSEEKGRNLARRLFDQQID